MLTGAEKAILTSDEAYRKLILQETAFEMEQKEITAQIADPDERARKYNMHFQNYWYRRLINADYFR